MIFETPEAALQTAAELIRLWLTPSFIAGYEQWERLPRPVRNRYMDVPPLETLEYRHPRCGHTLRTAEDIYPRPDGRRECRACKNEAKREARRHGTVSFRRERARLERAAARAASSEP